MASISLAGNSGGYLSHTRRMNSRSRSHIPIRYHTPVQPQPRSRTSDHKIQSRLKPAVSPRSPRLSDTNAYGVFT
jgi:hypothetical protein